MLHAASGFDCMVAVKNPKTHICVVILRLDRRIHELIFTGSCDQVAGCPAWPDCDH